jgi:hypothetical protein
MFWFGVPDGRLILDSAGDRGKVGASGEKTGVGGTKTGKLVVEGLDEGDDDDVDGEEEVGCPGHGGGGKTVGRPAVVP